ncbi:UNVERIFIED_CONTAM: hypothetical protein K2H54_016082 [Gekko kuhli]
MFHGTCRLRQLFSAVCVNCQSRSQITFVASPVTPKPRSEAEEGLVVLGGFKEGCWLPLPQRTFDCSSLNSPERYASDAIFGGAAVVRSTIGWRLVYRSVKPKVGSAVAHSFVGALPWPQKSTQQEAWDQQSSSLVPAIISLSPFPKLTLCSNKYSQGSFCSRSPFAY